MTNEYNLGNMTREELIKLGQAIYDEMDARDDMKAITCEAGDIIIFWDDGPFPGRYRYGVAARDYYKAKTVELMYFNSGSKINGNKIVISIFHANTLKWRATGRKLDLAEIMGDVWEGTSDIK